MFPYFKRFDIDITAANETYSTEFELDKDVKFVKGILLTSDQDSLLYYRGTQQLTVNGREYLPENFESKLLMSGINTDPNKRFYELKDAEAINGKIRVVYTDVDNVNTSFQAYRVSIYIKGLKENL
jgi:hypothetical protein